MPINAFQVRQETQEPGWWERNKDWVVPAGAALVGVAGTALGVREAGKNRAFQERMSSTAHQREVEDLKRAGINPMLSGMQGASQPSGAMADYGGLDRAVANALAVRQANATIELTHAQASQSAAQGRLANTQAADISTTAPDRYRVLAEQAAQGELSTSQIRQLMPELIKQAKAQVLQTQNAARQSRALAVLAELDKAGRVNIAKFEEEIGAMGPFGRYILEILRAVK